MRAIIMADGVGDRWLSSVQGTKFEGIPKQFITFRDKTLLERTVSLLNAHGVYDVWITSHNPQMEAPGARRYEPENNTHCLDKLHACKPIWDNTWGGTAFLYGDVVYSSDAIYKIITTQVKDKFLFFGRMHISYYSNHYHEIFCKKIEDFEYLEECINWIKTYEPSYGGGWELYRRMCGVELDQIREHKPYDHFITIDDATDDFDDYNHYVEWNNYWKWDADI
jgi:hypothetical protein